MPRPKDGKRASRFESNLVNAYSAGPDRKLGPVSIRSANRRDDAPDQNPREMNGNAEHACW